ncbi:hypothetical protein [Streptomyces sp. NPDC005970]|uniref:hypothetical protein n=1 Tax=Streptomyces sp. NPDC005970 TaxID=3156723 RepID=UPI0033FBF1A0
MTRIRPGPPLGKKGRAVSSSSALSKTRSQSRQGRPVRSASRTLGTATFNSTPT